MTEMERSAKTNIETDKESRRAVGGGEGRKTQNVQKREGNRIRGSFFVIYQYVYLLDAFLTPCTVKKG